MASGGGVIITPTILGPNPGLFIMRIWQGVVEVCLRIALAVCSLCTMGIAGTVVTNSSSLDALSRGAGVFVAVFGSLAVVVEATIIILRFLNIGLINIHMKQFLILDIVVSLVLLGGFVVSALIECVSAAKISSRGERWSRETSAAAVMCFICVLLAGFLAIWSILFLVRRWYYKMLQYMSLP